MIVKTGVTGSLSSPVLASSLDVRSQPEDVFVIGRKKIAPWLLRQPRRLRNEEVDKIFEFAIDPSSWKS
jgi:hypothetical protein